MTQPPGRDGPEAGAPPAVALTGVTKRFGAGRRSAEAVRDVTLHLAEGEFVCVLGPSGCGKSTLLALVSGLDTPSAGTVEVGGWRVALMFQEAALFPWLTAQRNVELALRLRGAPAVQRRTRATELLDLVHLGAAAHKRPHELSGGMRQRVALARALAQDAEVLLMDEPFGALDAMTRDSLHDELERVWLARRFTAMFVTHNVREAVRLSDRIVLMGGRPGQLLAEVPVDLPRPRRIDSAEVATRAAAVTDLLREEVARHGG